MSAMFHRVAVPKPADHIPIDSHAREAHCAEVRQGLISGD